MAKTNNPKPKTAAHTTKVDDSAKVPIHADPYFQALIENISDGIIILNQDATIRYESPRLHRILGFSPEEREGKSQLEFVHPDDLGKASQLFETLLEKPGYTTHTEVRAIHKNGTWRTLEVIGKNCIHEPHINGIVVNFRDITDSKIVEGDLKIKESAIENTLHAVAIADMSGKITYVNQACLRMWGNDQKDELIGKPYWVLLDAKDRVEEILESMTSQGKWEGEISAYRKDGEELHILVSSNVMNDDNGEPIQIVSSFIDITERKKAEYALRESEQRYRLITDNVTDVIWTRDMNLALTYISPSVHITSGYTPDEYMNKSLEEIMTPASVELCIESFTQALENEQDETKDNPECVTVELEFYNKDDPNTTRWAEQRMAFIRDDDGNPLGIVGVSHDITERKKAEDAIKEAERRYKAIFENQLQMVFIHDGEGKFIDANETAIQKMGWSREELESGLVNFTNIIYPDDIENAYKAVLDIIANGEMKNALEFRLVTRSGEILWIETFQIPLEITPEKYVGLGLAMDITERKKAEEALRSSEQQLKEIFDNVSDMVFLIDQNGKYINVNRRSIDIFGIDPDDMIGRHFSEFNYLPKEALEKVTKEWAEAMSCGERMSTVEAQARHVNGREIHAEVSLQYLTSGDGSVIGHIGMIRDSTKRIEAEQAVRASEKRFKEIFDNVADVIIYVDDKGNVKNINESAFSVIGYTPDELIGRNIFEMDIFDKEKMAEISSLYAECITQRKAVSPVMECSLHHKNGSTATVEIKTSIVNGQDDKLEGFLSIVRDITEQKKAEEILRDREYSLNKAQELAHVGSYEWNLRTGSFKVSDEMRRIYGLTIDSNESIEAIWGATVHPEDALNMNIAIEELVTGVSAKPFEYRIIRPDNEIRWILATKPEVKKYTADNKPEIIIGSIQDITDRKNAEKELLESEQRFKEIFNNASDQIIFISNEGIIENVNQRSFDVFGYPPEELIGRNFMELNIVEPEEMERIVSILGESDTDQHVQNLVEVKVKHKDGHKMFTEVNTRTVTTADGEKVGLLSLIRDITERKEAERAVRDSEAQYRLLAEHVNDVISIMDMDLNYLYLSPSIERLRGYTVEEAKSQKPEETMTKESLDRIFTETMNQFAAELSGEKDPNRTWSVEVEMFCKNGSKKWVDMSMSFLRDDNGNATGLLTSTRDVTERHFAQESLERRTQQILAIQKIISSIQSTMALKEVLQIISDAALQSLEFDHSFIMLMDKSTNVTRGEVFNTSGSMGTISSIEEIISQSLTALEIPMDHGISDAVDRMLEKKDIITHYLREVAQPALTAEESDSIQELLGAQTIVCVPMYAKDNPVGILIVFTAKYEITGVDMESLWLLADQAGIAIDNAQLNEELEERVNERTLQLQAANKELESFAYSLAHDLRTPLRGIDGFSQVLLEDYSDIIDEEGKNHLQRVRSASQRMSRIIDDILHLLKLSRTEMKHENVDLSQIARSICDDLRESDPDRKATFIINSGLETYGDVQMIREVLENLLGNAWKFTIKQENAVIEFGSFTDNNVDIFFVRDNGVGFDMKYTDKLFHPFQRLHSPKEFDSAGIGLATVQRIINRHKGQVWAEGAIDNGATFYFTL